MTTPDSVPSKLSGSDQIVRPIAVIQTRKDSTTMEFDKSQPPTPDGTGHPANFHQIAPGLYRSSYPAMPHFESLRTLELRTIVTLVKEELPIPYSSFITSDGIKHYQIPILANKDASLFSDAETVHKVLNIMLDPRNFPILIHCNKGRHRTGCMVACFRKVTGWTTDACIAEYVRYSSPKERDLDKKFIERFDPSMLKSIAYHRGYVGGVYKQPLGLSEESTKSSAYTNNTLEAYTSNDEDSSSVMYQDVTGRREKDGTDSSKRLSGC